MPGSRLLGARLRWVNRFLSWIRVLWFDYSRVPSTFDAVLLACLRCLRISCFVSVACSCDPTFVAYPREVPGLVFWACVVFGPLFFPELVRRFRCRFQLRFLSLPCAVLSRWWLFPQIHGFYRYFGVFCYCLRIFALAIIFLGWACGVAFSLHLPFLRLDLRLRLLALWVFAAGLITGCPCVCV